MPSSSSFLRFMSLQEHGAQYSDVRLIGSGPDPIDGRRRRPVTDRDLGTDTYFPLVEHFPAGH